MLLKTQLEKISGTAQLKPEKEEDEYIEANRFFSMFESSLSHKCRVKASCQAAEGPWFGHLGVLGSGRNETSFVGNRSVGIQLRNPSQG